LLWAFLPPSWSPLAMVSAIIGAAGFFVAVRIKCPHCGARLSKTLPAGGMILLWAAREHCQKCQGKLEW
jgi:hypothetical protein